MEKADGSAAADEPPENTSDSYNARQRLPARFQRPGTSFSLFIYTVAARGLDDRTIALKIEGKS